MKINFLHKVLPLLLLAAVSCHRMEENPGPLKDEVNSAAKISATLTETFETGTKTAYTAADVTLSTGVWNLNDALLGTSTSDRKAGTQSARVVNSGRLSMKFDKAGGAGTVSISHAKFGTDANGSWQLWYSTNSGTSYTQAGSTISTVATTLATTTFTLNLSGSVRIEIRKIAGTNRINFDNITITDFSSTTSNPVPALSTLSPSSAAAGSAALTLNLTGTNFINGSVVNWNGTAIPTTFVSSSSLTASVASALLATAGTAAVNVLNPAPGGGTSGSLTFTISTGTPSTAKKFLFDASQAETAGNADWVVDQDNGVFAAAPTPAQSGITSSTSETYWLGGISAWGVALAKRGHSISTLPAEGLITFGSTTNTQDLSKYDVFVICEPNKAFTTAEKQAIVNYVNNGGGLVLVGNHNGSDRDNDGWDAPRILNDLFTNNGIRANPFGMSLDLLSFSGASSNVSSTASPITNGLAGVVTSMENNSGTSITINTTANSSVRGHIWRSGTTQNSNNVLCASSTYGTGRVFMIGDSSPPDDGTGASGNTLFNGWGLFNHAALLTNASLWAAKLQ